MDHSLLAFRVAPCGPAATSRGSTPPFSVVPTSHRFIHSAVGAAAGRLCITWGSRSRQSRRASWSKLEQSVVPPSCGSMNASSRETSHPPLLWKRFPAGPPMLCRLLSGLPPTTCSGKAVGGFSRICPRWSAVVLPACSHHVFRPRFIAPRTGVACGYACHPADAVGAGDGLPVGPPPVRHRLRDRVGTKPGLPQRRASRRPERSPPMWRHFSGTPEHRSRSRETYLSAEQPQAGPQARLPRPQGHPRWPRRAQGPPGQGPPQAECVIGSVSRRRTFTDLRREGRRVRHGSVRIRFLPLPIAEPQVAFAIGRSFGNAVERNRARRRLRAAFVEAWRNATSPGSSPPLGAYLLTGGRGLLHARFAHLVADVGRCFDRLAGGEPPGGRPAMSVDEPGAAGA